MTSPPSSCVIRSVLVALDDATSDSETMETAVTLAVDLEAELQGLYFENDSLLRAAELPFVHEITGGSGTVRSLDAHSLQRAMRNRAERVRQVLERWAQSAQIRCSFEVTHERAKRRALLASSESEVVFFGSRSHAPAVRRPMGLRPPRISKPLLLLVDESPRRELALATAMVVASNHSFPIILQVLAHSREQFDRLSAIASETLCQRELPHTLLPHPVSKASALIQTVRSQRPHLLVLNRQCEILGEDAIDSLLDQIDTPVVLV